MRDAVSYDAVDPLASFRERFLIDDPETLYLDGNSLGRLPHAAAEAVANAMEQQWGERLVRGWSEGWMELPTRLGDKIGRLIGAQPGETLACDSTSTNFYKLALAALKANSGRTKILTDDLNFPSDLYLLQGIADQVGGGVHIEVAASGDGIHGAPLEERIDQHTALVTLSHAVFKSGYLYDIERITSAAHRYGALVLLDFSHSVGVVPIDVQRSKVDLAVGCTYKYLNGGPGAPAFLFVRRDLQSTLSSPMWGWLGHEKPFQFDPDYRPSDGIRRFQCGTPSILSMVAAEASVDIVLEAGIEAIRAKSILMTEFMADRWERDLADRGVSLNSPRESAVRGSHISLGMEDAYRIDRALIERKHVIPDFRAPDNIRFGVAPLYNSFVEVSEAFDRLVQVLEEGPARDTVDFPEVT